MADYKAVVIKTGSDFRRSFNSRTRRKEKQSSCLKLHNALLK